jgi:hypothetical protein
MLASSLSLLAVSGGGVPGAYYRVAGHTFVAVDPNERASYRNAQQMATLAVVTGYDRDREQAERSWPWTAWRGNIGPDGCLLHAKPQYEQRWQVDQLVVWRDEHGRRSPGWVRRIGTAENRELELTVMSWPGEARALDLIPVGSLLRAETNLPGLLLPAVGKEQASLILPLRVFSSGKRLQTRGSGTTQVFRLSRSIQRGADFERVVFDTE